MMEVEVLDRLTFKNGLPHGKKGKNILTEVGLVTLFDEGLPVAEFVSVPGELFPESVQGGFLTGTKECWKVTERKKAMDGIGRERIGASNPHIKPAIPFESHFKSPHPFILGLANDELGYIVPENDFVFPRYTPKPEHGKDRCGDDDHYEETLSVSSKMAPILTNRIIDMLKESD